MIMEKPKLQYEFHGSERYPEVIEQYHEWITDGMSEVNREYLCQLIENVYKTAFLDGFQTALFFSDIY